MTTSAAHRGQGSFAAAPAQAATRRGRPSKRPKVTYTCEICFSVKTAYAHPNRTYRACSRQCAARLARNKTRKHGKPIDRSADARWRKMRANRNHQISHENMFRRGQCALHPTYNNGSELHVTIDNLPMFAWDHIDRTLKYASVAKLKHRNAEQLQTEIDKCQLVCHNCHAMKSKEHNDHVPVDKQTTNKLTLF